MFKIKTLEETLNDEVEQILEVKYKNTFKKSPKYKSAKWFYLDGSMP